MTRLRSEKVINKEIEKLKALKPRVRERSGFGDDNHAAIDGQINVLKDHLDIRDIDAWPVSSYVRDSAIEAHEWLWSERKEPPSEGWAELVR